jgi:glyoxylase-like metal-dependent hydrolase (beta-lactamase superfamily II)
MQLSRCVDMGISRLFKSGIRCHLRHLFIATVGLIAASANAVEVRFEPVAEGVYAFVGELGPRTVGNEGLNANIGLVVTPAGVVLIDSGATFNSARQIHEALQRVTSQPVRWVVNTGGQDHRWLGNGYFKAQGAEIIAHQQAKADMNSRIGDQLEGLRTALGPLANDIIPTLASRWITQPNERLVLGGVVLEFKYRGGAHTPGDMLVWLPQKQVVFTGDVVYVDRLLGVLPFSQTKPWLATFAEIERLAPLRIVPGHGRVTDLATAQADTRDYLMALRSQMKKAVDDGVDPSTAIKSFDTKPFMRLLNAADLMPGNASRTYLELERE